MHGPAMRLIINMGFLVATTRLYYLSKLPGGKVFAKWAAFTDKLRWNILKKLPFSLYLKNNSILLNCNYSVENYVLAD